MLIMKHNTRIYVYRLGCIRTKSRLNIDIFESAKNTMKMIMDHLLPFLSLRSCSSNLAAKKACCSCLLISLMRILSNRFSLTGLPSTW